MSTTRRGFLKILGLAPLLPLAAKLPGKAPANLIDPAPLEAGHKAILAAVATQGLTMEKLRRAKELLDKAVYPVSDIIVYFPPGHYYLPEKFTFEKGTMLVGERTPTRTWKGRRAG